METIEALLTRRSVREFVKEKAVSKEQLELLFKAAMQAPSAHNYQPWHFIRIDDRKLLDAIAEAHPYGKMLYQAPLAVAVCGDKSKEPDEGYLALDCAAATENLLLAVHAQGLGGVWIAVYPKEERIRQISQLLHLPEKIVPISLVAIGHPAQKNPPVSRFKPGRIHKNQW